MLLLLRVEVLFGPEVFRASMVVASSCHVLHLEIIDKATLSHDAFQDLALLRFLIRKEYVLLRNT